MREQPQLETEAAAQLFDNWFDPIEAGLRDRAREFLQALLLLDTQHYGILIAQIFFGLWLVPLGYIAYKSAGMFPRWLGVLLIVGGVCYLVDLLALFLVPDVGNVIHGFVTIPSAIAEISMVLYLLVIGVKTVKPDGKARRPASVALAATD